MKLPKTPNDLDKFVRNRGLRPVGKMEYRGAEIYLAETDLEFSKDHPHGLYQVAWFASTKASRGKFDVGSWVEFDSLHDLHLSDSMRHEGRINSAKRHAQDWVDKNIETGRHAAN